MQNGKEAETEGSLTAAIKTAANYISSLLTPELKHPQVGIICGSGLSGLARLMEEAITIPYSHIPGFPRATVEGHQNAVKIGQINGTACMVFLGRFHAYEGLSHRSTTLPVRILAMLNVSDLIITNASGSVNPEHCKTGDIMVVEDHINFSSFAGINPLTGPNLREFGPRFPSLHGCYCPKSLELVKEAAKLAGIPDEIIKKGVYAYVGGPSYETPAEVRYLRNLGAHAVGMSTVPEVIVAAHCQQIKRCLVLSLITNEPSQADWAEGPTHEEVLAVAAARSLELQNLVNHLISLLSWRRANMVQRSSMLG